MSLFDITAVVIIALYALGTLGTFWGIPAGRSNIKALSRLFTVAGFVAHTFLVGGIVFSQGTIELSKGFFMQLLAWVVVLVYFMGWRWVKSSFISVTAAPFALLFFLLAFKLDHVQGELPDTLMGLFFALHIGPMFLSLALLALAFGAALLFLRMERKIKTKSKLSRFDQGLPSLDVFERINHKVVIFGFPLYTLGLAAGFIWAPVTWQEGNWRTGAWDPKEIITLLVWFMYAILFHLHLIKGWRGRKAAILVIMIFSVSVFSLVGVNFFLPTHHSFSISM